MCLIYCLLHSYDFRVVGYLATKAKGFFVIKLD